MISSAIFSGFCHTICVCVCVCHWMCQKPFKNYISDSTINNNESNPMDESTKTPLEMEQDFAFDAINYVLNANANTNSHRSSKYILSKSA